VTSGNFGTPVSSSAATLNNPCTVKGCEHPRDLNTSHLCHVAAATGVEDTTSTLPTSSSLQLLWISLCLDKLFYPRVMGTMAHRCPQEYASQFRTFPVLWLPSVPLRRSTTSAPSNGHHRHSFGHLRVLPIVEV